MEENVVKEISHLSQIWDKLIDYGTELGKHILIAIVIYFVGRYLIKLLEKLFARMLDRRKVQPEVKGFLSSLIHFCWYQWWELWVYRPPHLPLYLLLLA